MTEETEIYKEWYELYFGEPPSPQEYMYYRETLDFQRYLLWYRGKELVQTIREELLFKKARLNMIEIVVGGRGCGKSHKALGSALKELEKQKFVNRHLLARILALESENAHLKADMKEIANRDLQIAKEADRLQQKYSDKLKADDELLDKIKAEIDNALSDGMIHKKTVLGIIDKYKKESEAGNE